MRRNPRILLVVVLLLAAACGDDTDDDDDQSSTDEGTEVVVELGLDEPEAEAVVGDAVVVTLDENQSVGDLWQLAEEPDDAVLSLISDEAIGPEEEDCDGCGGTREIRFAAVGEGETSFVVANCFRCNSEGEPSEAPPEPAEVEFSVEVTS